MFSIRNVALDVASCLLAAGLGRNTGISPNGVPEEEIILRHSFPIRLAIRPLFVAAGTALALLIGAGVPMAQTNLLQNPSFEDRDGICINTQGILPVHWLQAGNIAPGADTFNDGDTTTGVCEGLRDGTPQRFGHWSGVKAEDGDHWVAGAEFGGGAHESVGQALSSPLTPASTYRVEGHILRDEGVGRVIRRNSGGYEIWLSTGPNLAVPALKVGEFASTDDPAAWAFRSMQEALR